MFLQYIFTAFVSERLQFSFLQEIIDAFLWKVSSCTGNIGYGSAI